MKKQASKKSMQRWSSEHKGKDGSFAAIKHNIPRLLYTVEAKMNSRAYQTMPIMLPCVSVTFLLLRSNATTEAASRREIFVRACGSRETRALHGGES